MKLGTGVHPTFHYVSIKSGAQTTNTVTEAEGGGAGGRAIRFNSRHDVDAMVRDSSGHALHVVVHSISPSSCMHILGTSRSCSRNRLFLGKSRYERVTYSSVIGDRRDVCALLPMKGGWCGFRVPFCNSTRSTGPTASSLVTLAEWSD